MRKLLALFSLALLPLASAATANANAPTQFTVPINVATPIVVWSCTPFGQSFNVLATATGERHYIQFYDDSGNLVKEIRHVVFTGTLYRSDDLTKTIPYGGNWTRTYLPDQGLVINTGLHEYSHPDGSGMVTLDPGRTVTTWPPPTTELSDTGPTFADAQSDICAYLAAE